MGRCKYKITNFKILLNYRIIQKNVLKISFPVTTASAFSFHEIFVTFIHWSILFNSWKVLPRKFENSSLGSISRELGSDCLERHRRTCHATVNHKTKNYISSVPITENTIPLLQPLQWRFLSVK